jgi:hypothetical protein
LSYMLNITAHAKIARLKTRSNEKGHWYLLRGARFKISASKITQHISSKCYLIPVNSKKNDHMLHRLPKQSRPPYPPISMLRRVLGDWGAIKKRPFL